MSTYVGVKFQCDAEVGRPGNWRHCKCTAVIERMSIHGTIMRYCKRHANRATNPTIKNFTPAPGSVAEPIRYVD